MQLPADQLAKILDLLKKWLNEPDSGKQADLSRVDLSEVNLSGADLSGVNLSEANLSGANLSGANLYRPIFTGPTFMIPNSKPTTVQVGRWIYGRSSKLLCRLGSF